MPSSISHDNAARSAEGSALERALVEWLRTEFEDPEIVGADNFLDIGGHSLAFAKLNRFLEESFGVGLDMKTAYEESLSAAAAKAQPISTSA